MSTLSTSACVTGIRGARLLDGSVVDLRTDGPVVEVAPVEGPGVLDADGLVLPAAVEPHAHLDKCLSVALTGGAQRDLRAAIGAWAAYAEAMTEADVAARARTLLRRYLARGVTAVRSHVDIYPGPDPFRAIRAVAALRAEVADVLDLQVVCLALPDAPDGLVVEALRQGADLVGGAPHLADDPPADARRLLDLAERHGVGVDLHTDENLDGGPSGLAELAAQVAARTLASVTASHCVGLATLPAAERAATVQAVARGGIGVVVLPITNLYLMGRDAGPLAPRGIAPVRELLAGGVVVAAGADNVQDPFIPVGTGDPFETASLLVTAAHLDPVQALDLIGPGGRRVLGLPPAGVGGVADLVLLDVAHPAEAAAGPGEARTVLHAGRVVARTTVERSVAEFRRP